MHRAGVSALTKLMQFQAPDAGHLEVPCSCDHTARLKDMRAKSFLSVVGTVEVLRPYDLCAHCSRGQHPVDGELGIAGLESSPGVRRMEANLGAEMPFAMKLLAGLEVPAKAIERAAESIGTQIAQRDQQEIDMAKNSSFCLSVIRRSSCPRRFHDNLWLVSQIPDCGARLKLFVDVAGGIGYTPV
jgi:hypothetical protein